MNRCSQISLLVLLLVITACGGNKPFKLAFASNRDGNWEIYLMNSDGSDIANVSHNPYAADTQPRWSPNGSLLAYSSDTGVIIANQAGEVVGEYTPENQLANHPSWSSDSEFVAFHSTDDGNFEIYTMRYDGSDITRLTYQLPSDESCPNWSPDGKYILYGSHPKPGAGFDLHIMRSDGTDATDPLKSWAGTFECPVIDWSPDGEQLAVVAALDSNLTVFEWGQPHQELIIAECATGYPDWSPDGTKIAFAGDECTNSLRKSEIYVVNSDGTNLVRLTDNSHGDHSPVWSPDGRKIAFISTRDGNREISIMNNDGSQQRNLTQNDGYDTSPEWQP